MARQTYDETIAECNVVDRLVIKKREITCRDDRHTIKYQLTPRFRSDRRRVR